MSSSQKQKLNPEQSLAFEDVSKLFPLPLSEAADILGVSTSVLKKLCIDNGLERWPHRKYLAGKSIEEIKKEATREKSKVPGKINVTTVSAVSCSPGFHIKDKTSRSATEMSRSQTNTHHPGVRNIKTWRSHHLLASGMAIEASTCLDDFKHGFPSSGLSRYTNKWWESGSDDPKTVPKVEHSSETQADDSSATLCDDHTMKDSGCDMQKEVSLSTIRKRARDEGKQALKLGVRMEFGVDKLGKKEKILLHRLFQTS